MVQPRVDHEQLANPPHVIVYTNKTKKTLAQKIKNHHSAHWANAHYALLATKEYAIAPFQLELVVPSCFLVLWAVATIFVWLNPPGPYKARKQYKKQELVNSEVQINVIQIANQFHKHTAWSSHWQPER